MVLDGGDRVAARSVILASGVSWRQLDVPGADALVGRGIYYGAARTEAMNCQGQHVFLVGGGNSAGQAAMFFANYAHKVSLLVRGPVAGGSMSHYLIQQLATKSNIEICTRCRIVRVEGDHHLEADRHRAPRHRRAASPKPASAVFVFIGADAQTDWLPATMIRDENGYVCTGRDVMDLVAGSKGTWPLDRDPYLLETSVPGIFAAGDVRHGSVKRVASGVGEGSMAIAFVHQFLAARPVAAGGVARTDDARTGNSMIGVRRRIRDRTSLRQPYTGIYPIAPTPFTATRRRRPRRPAARARLHDRPGCRRHLHPGQLFGAVPAHRRRTRDAGRPVPRRTSPAACR